jgi:NAD(P)H-dependent flavin oxidoreductase YrpB (nitropropane dioxygenase family)
VTLLEELGVQVPIVAAPMAGGPTTPELVVAAAQAGGLGFLAAGYRTVDQLAEQIRSVRAHTEVFGVNVFVPNPVHADGEEFRMYARALQPAADRYGLTLNGGRPHDDADGWEEKIALLLADPVPVVSFTFGLPDRGLISRLRRAGSRVVQTVTSPQEAGFAAEAGVDGLAVQAAAAGGHSGTFTARRLPVPIPLDHLLAEVRAVTPLPLLAAGGLATSEAVAEALGAGAQAAVVGTALLCADEAGTSQTHRSAVLAAAGDGSDDDGARADETVLTRAFTGRYARGLRNGFTTRYDPIAPAGYPAIHHLTSPLRKAAAAAGDADQLHLWAGTGYRHVQARPAAEILAGLLREL